MLDSPNQPQATPPVNESSVQFMLAEFNRIQAGELYNRSKGDERVSSYITLISLVGGGIVALQQLVNQQEFYFIAFIGSTFVSLIGTVAFRMLLERWRLTVIYLRKLARIRGWFVRQDPTLRGNLAYTTDETYPSFVSMGLLSSSLITLVLTLNGVSIAATAIFLVAMIFPTANLWVLAILGSSIAILAWFVKYALASKALRKLQEDSHIAIPPPPS
jgi:hypothetical protein